MGTGSGRRLFREQGLRAKRSFGQCFLADPNIARRIALEATTPEGGTVLEIGAGTGALTAPLLARASCVVAIERDRDLIPVLSEAFAEPISSGRLLVVEADAAAVDWVALLLRGASPRVVAGNVPYQITGRLIERAAGIAAHVDRVVFMVQREVADRIAAPVGSADYGALSVFVRRSFRVTRRIPVPPSCFRPQPSVHSSVIVLDPVRPSPGEADEVLQTLVLTSFSHRRKTLRNAWKGAFGLGADVWERIAEEARIDLAQRAQTLEPVAFDQVAEAIRASVR